MCPVCGRQGSPGVRSGMQPSSWALSSWVAARTWLQLVRPPASPVRWAEHPPAELSRGSDGIRSGSRNTSRRQLTSTQKTRRRGDGILPPLPEKTPGPRVRPAARVSLASPDCAPVGPPLKAVKAPLLTKKVPPIVKKRQSSYAWFVGRAAAGAQRDPSGQAHLGGRRGGVVAQQVLALRAPGPPSACQGH